MIDPIRKAEPHVAGGLPSNQSKKEKIEAKAANVSMKIAVVSSDRKQFSASIQTTQTSLKKLESVLPNFLRQINSRLPRM